MSIAACIAFLRDAGTSEELKQSMKAVTDTREVIALGQKYGYAFDVDDLLAASSSLSAENGSHNTTSQQARPAFYHYEFAMDQLPGFAGVIREMSNLLIKPSSVDLRLYAHCFRDDDFHFTSLSPASPEFQQRYQEIMHARQETSPGEFRRDFHLVNLDQHVDHPQYEPYFQAKTRMISLLEGFFGGEVRFSGSMWYPPQAYRLWHTNETQPGWRMYLIDFDEPAGDPAGTSFFRYMNPESKEIVTLTERPRLVRFFKIEQEREKLFWHCIVNATTRNRWSFGFAVPENWLERCAQER